MALTFGVRRLSVFWRFSATGDLALLYEAEQHRIMLTACMHAYYAINERNMKMKAQSYHSHFQSTVQRFHFKHLSLCDGVYES